MAAQAALDLLINLKDNASGPLEKITGALGGLGKVAGGAALGGIAALGATLASGVSDAREAALVMAQTESVIKSTGGAAGFTADQIADMAGSLSAASGKSLFGDDDIQKGQNLLLTFTNIKTTLPDATKVMVDMATAMGTDVSGGAVQLGKALNDPINGISALSRVGVTFTDQQKEQIKTMQEAGDMAGAQQVILAELNKEFGGSAAAAAAADGGWAQLKDTWGEIVEGAGAQLLPLLNQFTAWLTSPEVLAGIQAFADGLTQGIGAFVEWFQGTAWPILQEIFGWLMDTALPALQAAFQAAWPIIKQAVADAYEFLSGTVWPWLRDTAFPWLQNTALPALQRAFEVAWPIIQKAVSVVYTFLKDVVWSWLQGTAWPWLVGTALPALQRAFEVVWPIIQKAVSVVYDFFRNTVWPWIEEAFRNTAEHELPAIQRAFEVAWPIIKTAVQTAYTFLRDTVWPWLQTATSNIVTWIQTAQGKWSEAWSAIHGAVTTAKNVISGAIDTIKGVVQGAINLINDLIGLINKLPGVQIPSIPGVTAKGLGDFTSLGPQLPGTAGGGGSSFNSGGLARSVDQSIGRQVIVNVDARQSVNPQGVGDAVQRGIERAIGQRADLRLRTS